MSDITHTDMRTVEPDLVAALRTIRKALKPRDDTPNDYALCVIETYIAVSLRVLAKSDPELVKSEARNVELQARLERRPVLRQAA